MSRYMTVRTGKKNYTMMCWQNVTTFLSLVRNMVCLLSFLFRSRPVQSRPNGPHTLSFRPPAKLASSSSTEVAPPGLPRIAAPSNGGAPRFAQVSPSRLHYTHVPASFHIAQMKFNFSFLPKIRPHTLMSNAIKLHQIVLIASEET